MFDSRQDFTDTWLFEMPMGLGSFQTFDQLDYIIRDRIKHGATIIDLPDDLKKIVGPQIMYYWFQCGDEIALGIELQNKPQGLVISIVGKNPKFSGRPPYASDLYDLILKDNEKSLRLVSDDSLSDEGYEIWKRLYQLGHKVSVYDRTNPGQSFTTLYSLDDMDKYFAHDDPNFRRYQYVLSESGDKLGEVRSLFHTRRYRELIPGLL